MHRGTLCDVGNVTQGIVGRDIVKEGKKSSYVVL
jgi:hypothetical protein